MTKKGVNIFNLFTIDWFRYIYLFVMVIYMGQMTDATSRMVGSLSGNPIPFLIPIVLTVFLLSRHRFSWRCKWLWGLCCILFLWSIAVLAKYHSLTNVSEWSFIFFLFYAVIMAYIHVRVYGRKLFPVYEHIMVVMSKICLALWVLNIIFYSHPSLVSLFPETNLGNSVAYLYHWLTPDKAKPDTWMITLRNSGCSWEPGRFSVMLVLAVYCNLSRRGISFHRNSSLLWLLAAIISTQSTTGYVITLILFAIFTLTRFNTKNFIIFCALVFPAVLISYRLDFMGDKISKQLDVNEVALQNVFDYENQTLSADEYLGSLSRFEAIYFEWQNIGHDPLLGYGRNTDNSYFSSSVSSNYVLTGGLLKIFGQHGIFVGLFLYLILFLSSARTASMSNVKIKPALALILVFSSVSYVIWTVPVFTAFWLYGVFSKKPGKKYLIVVNGDGKAK